MKNEGWRKYLCESLQPKSLFSVKEALVVARVTPSGIHSPGSSRVFSEGTGRHLIRETGNHTSAHAPRLWSRGQHCEVLFDRDEQHGRGGSGKKKTLWYGRRCKQSKGNFQLNFSSDLLQQLSWLCIFVWEKNAKMKVCFAIVFIINPPTIRLEWEHNGVIYFTNL